MATGSRSTAKALKKELKEDNWLRISFGVAKELGMTVSQLWREATVEEILGWVAFLELQADDMERAQKEAAKKARIRR